MHWNVDSSYLANLTLPIKMNSRRQQNKLLSSVSNICCLKGLKLCQSSLGCCKLVDHARNLIDSLHNLLTAVFTKSMCEHLLELVWMPT